MQEDFLHYIWKHKKIDFGELKTTNNEDLIINSVGTYNTNSGPDFFNSKIKIGNQLWAGNVEIHVKSSDWFLHNHETDMNYDNVILHVVWEEDTEVFRKDNTVLPTLELNSLVKPNTLENYRNLFSKGNKWINCENDFNSISPFLMNNWLERLYFERLERKSGAMDTMLKSSKNNWEAVLFKMLLKNFGLKVNGNAFGSLGNSIDFSIVRKVQSNHLSLEALLFGQMGLLENSIENAYYMELSKEYKFLKQKFGLDNTNVIPAQFFRLRPLNFPTIRLSQLACLYNKHQNLFSKIIETSTIEDFYDLLNVGTSNFWNTHYTFQKESKARVKMLSKSFIDLLLINTVLPLKFSYNKQNGISDDSILIDMANAIKPEKNNVISAFNRLKDVANTSLHSQALIQLKSEYCNKHRCLQCAIGNSILNK
ncbi:DUF2851 family protein [Seonamhaeicola marinus]|uniref:DUF2851 family protein n=2 Tax=Seonamhaeicola marinus TaxID=1912246 RepID=A0A5D0IUD7_9FLAO|nr:DUF2851 family protein [Seonamhaeicola marinus]